MKKFILILIVKVFCLSSISAQEYNASLFGCVSDGITNNTSSIQYAIDFISKKGGGKLNFYVGRYLTGGLMLKSNVTIELHEGAILLTSPNINDYQEAIGGYSFLVGDSVSNCNLIGKGVIEFQPSSMLDFLTKINAGGVLLFQATQLPTALTLIDCQSVKVDGIMFLNVMNTSIQMIRGNNVTLDNITIKSKDLNGSGLYLDNVKDVKLKNIYVDVKGKPFYKTNGAIISSAEKCIIPNGKTFIK